LNCCGKQYVTCLLSFSLAHCNSSSPSPIHSFSPFSPALLISFLAVIMSDEEAQAIVDQALKSGSIEQRNRVAVVVGIAGSGKTSLISRLFKKTPPEEYNSTGIAEQSLRGLTRRTADICSWELLEPKNILKFLAPFILAASVEANIAFLAKKSIEEEAPELTQAPSGELPIPQPTATTIHTPAALTSPSPSHSITALPTTHSIAAAHREQEKSHASNTMTTYLKEVTNPEKTDTIDLLHIIDTGGQPEFMEIMPSLIHNSNFTVLVLNLDQSLDDPPHFALCENGETFKRHHYSIFKNRQVIHQLVGTMQGKWPTHKGKQHSKVSVIGTHRDCVQKKGKLHVTLAAMNEEVKRTFLPKLEDELIVYRTRDEIIFPLNLKEPDEHDNEVLKLIQMKISNANIGEKANIPVSFSMFEHEAIKCVEQQNGKDKQAMVLSLDQCIQVGKKLNMDSEVVQAALIYFHRHNIFLYFQHILPNVVFLAPQVPLDFVNAIVAISYKVKSGAFYMLPPKYFCKEGIITEEMLCNKSLQLSDHFIPGIYEPQDAIKLFLHIYAIAPLSNEEPLAKDQQPHTSSSTPEQKLSEKKRIPDDDFA